MLIGAIPSGPLETNAYVIGCENSHLAAIIDPAPASSSLIIKYLTDHQLTPKSIILTHSHWDHIADVAEVKRHFAIPVLIHKGDAKNLQMPGSDGLPCWIAIEGVKPDLFLSEGDKIEIGDLRLKVIHTPGHTPGCICLYEEAHRVLISGDTLFKGTIGNISFPTSLPKLIWQSLDKLAKLPGDTVVYPGHGEKTTIASESWLKNAEKIFGDSL